MTAILDLAKQEGYIRRNGHCQEAPSVQAGDTNAECRVSGVGTESACLTPALNGPM